MVYTMIYWNIIYHDILVHHISPGHEPQKRLSSVPRYSQFPENASKPWNKGGNCHCLERQERPPDSNRCDLALNPIQAPFPFTSPV